MRITIIHNSGSGERTLSGQDLIAAAADAGHRASYASTDDESAVVKHLSDPGDLVVIVGGDGTMRNVATRLIGRKVPVTLIPAGTANNIGKSLGITGQARDLVSGWTTGSLIQFDTGVVRGANGTCAMFEGMGFGPIAVTIAALSPLTEAEARADFTDDEVRRDLKVLREVLADYPVHECSVKLDGQDLSGDYILVEAMNIRSVGPSIELAPDADVSDGMFDLVLLTDADRGTLRDYLTSRLEGKPVPIRFPARRGRHVELGWHGSRVHIDDQVWPHERDASSGHSWSHDGRVEIEVLMNPGSLQVLVPRPAPPAIDASPDDSADVTSASK